VTEMTRPLIDHGLSIGWIFVFPDTEAAPPFSCERSKGMTTVFRFAISVWARIALRPPTCSTRFSRTGI
jgi:hypothetical protein